MANWYEKRMKELGYKGCRNCKHQIEPLRGCEWLEHGGDGVIHLICPKWEKKKMPRLMKITEELANEIMEGLFHLALSAYGNTESEWALDTAMIYALQTFEKIINDWEDGLGMECEIIKTESTMWVMDKESHRGLTFPKENGTSVRHGHWIRNDNGTYSCSECYSWVPDEQHYYARYCLFCGAKMDEVEDV